MSLVTACLRPSGASYRDALLNHEPHHNPSEIIDNLLADNNGYLVYQEDVIKFLQQICGLSGSEADNIRRAIGRKDRDRLDAAMPQILEGYCSKSDKPREEAEREAKEFVQILEDSALYMFGFNHSVAYCLLGYLCAYYRYYHPIAFAASFLNNAANNDDIKNGTEMAKRYGIKISLPKFGLSGGEYTPNEDEGVIAKGAGSIKGLSVGVADEIYALSKERHYTYFIDLLGDILFNTSANKGHVEALIKVDYFSEFGNQRECLRIGDAFMFFKKQQGMAKKVRKADVANTPLDAIVATHSSAVTKNGKDASTYTILDMPAILHECEDKIKSVGMLDLNDRLKDRNFEDLMGYAGYVSGKSEDRRKLVVMGVYPVRRKRDDYLFGYSITTRSIGSGIVGKFTVMKPLFEIEPIKKGDMIVCESFVKDRGYNRLTQYSHLD